MPSLPVKVLTHGTRDAVRGNYPELPVPGTRGIILFPSGDPRNGHWIGATDPALNDASTHSPQVGNIAYSAHYGGGWSWRGQDGTVAEVWPDGTSILIGSSTIPPTPTRHTVDPSGVRSRTPFTSQQRVPNAPGAFTALLRHPSGAQARLDNTGAWSVLAAPGRSITLTVNRGAQVTLGGDGSITLAATTDVTITASGTITLTAPQIVQNS